MEQGEVKENGWAWGMCADNERLIVGCGEDLVVYRINTLEREKKIKTSNGLGGYIRRCEFMPGEKGVLGICRFNGICNIFSIEKEADIQVMEGPECEIKSISFNGNKRVAVSTREGSVWVWKMDDGVWEIEEIIEYSDGDVKSVLWHRGALITMGYCGEIIMYTLWENEICDVKWEMDQILQCSSSVWDGCIAEKEGEHFLGCTTQDGDLYIYQMNSTEKWAEVYKENISIYPIRSVCMCRVDGKEMFCLIVDRQVLRIVDCRGQKYASKKILGAEEEPMDIIYSEKEKSIFVLSVSFVKLCRYTHIHRIRLDELDNSV